jgi:hypothetical protein
LTDTLAAGCVVFAENFALAVGYHGGDFGLRAIAAAAVLVVALMHSVVPRCGVRIMVCIGHF